MAEGEAKTRLSAQCKSRSNSDSRLLFKFTMSAASIDTSLEFTGGICVLTHEHLDTNRIIDSVKDDGAGAIAVFIGTTRNSFKGRYPSKLTR